MGEPKLGGKLRERAGQIDRTAVGAGIEAQKMADALARERILRCSMRVRRFIT